MIILPAIDLIGGRCVRLSQGDYNQQTQYEATPADMVKQYVAHGLKRIHVGGSKLKVLIHFSDPS